MSERNGEMKNYLISIDDTDDVTKRVSTGQIAEIIGRRLTEAGGKVGDGISRHQLLLSDEIAYTSHNSSMCIDVEFEEADSGEIASICEEVIRQNMARVSDPGFAVCCLDRLSDPDRLIEFGFEAKRKVKKKDEAYALASGIEGVILKELGGTGGGVIGALAGIGLRLSRSDGSLRGKTGSEFSGEFMRAGEICRRFGAELVITRDGAVLGEAVPVRIDKFIKLMYSDGHKCCIVRREEDGTYVTIHQHQEREKFMEITGQAVCADFVPDNDEEEFGIPQGAQSCFNCLYRRWLDCGFRCMKAEE